MKQTTRRRRILELWAIGTSIPQTVKTMRKEGFRVSEKTVYRDRHSLEMKEMIDELTRRQLNDIDKAKPILRMKYRDKILEKLMPHKIETDQQITQFTLTTPFDADPDMKRLLLEAAAKQKAEKDAGKPSSPRP
jgi:hypothetical protein